ncbi:MAG: type IV secretion system DNA-binding domain-containing protein, partial [Pseudomonadota bacterium]
YGAGAMTNSQQSGPLKTFLRGGQTTLHTLRMFGQVMRFIGFSMVILALFITWAGVMKNTTPDERYYAMKHYEAGVFKWGYETFNRTADLKLNMRDASGEERPYPVDYILTNPVVSDYEMAFREVFFSWLLIGGAGGVGGFILIVAMFINRGAGLTKTDFKRGAEKASANDLKAAIGQYNRRMQRQRKIKTPTRFTLAGVPYPLGAEIQHTAISGTIGSGKTQAISELLDQIRKAGDRAVVFDLTGGFIEPFYRADIDTILNPLDRRAPAWSIFSEANTKSGFDAIASAMIPTPQRGDPVWADSARMVFSTAAQLLVGDGKPTNNDLIHTLLNMSLGDLGAFFKGTPATTIIDPSSPRMSNSVRMMLSTYLECLRLLPDDGEPFSIRNWIEKSEEESTLFLSTRADMHETLKPLLTVRT